MVEEVCRKQTDVGNAIDDNIDERDSIDSRVIYPTPVSTAASPTRFFTIHVPFYRLIFKIKIIKSVMIVKDITI